MPHQFQVINCKKCDNQYCPVCKRVCPKCGEYDISDDATMVTRSAMRLHMEKELKKEKAGFAERFKKHREFIGEKTILLKSLTKGIDGFNKLKNLEEAETILKQIQEAEDEFMLKDGENLKQLEEWIKANPK